MRRIVLPAFFACSLISPLLSAQLPSLLRLPSAYADPEPTGGGGGQAEYTAERGNAFSRFATGFTVSSLGIGVDAGTNVGTRVDVRIFGNYTNLTHHFSRSGFDVALNVGMANAGAMGDFYFLRRFPLRVSPGFLCFNGNELSGNVHARNGATFTLNNVQYASDDSNPVRGTGRLLIGGSGFMVTAGIGHFVSRMRRRVTFPFDGGVVFINRPIAEFNLSGNVCALTVPRGCEPAAQFPGFAANLAAEVASWNRTAAAYHIYPIFQGGVAYSFTLRRRGVE